MEPFRHVLIPTDFSLCAEAALRHGLFLAARDGADVSLLHVAAPASPGRPADDAGADAWHRLRPRVEQEFEEQLRGRLRRVVTQQPEAAPAILALAHQRAADLIVLGAHGDRGEGRFLNQGAGLSFLGRTAEQVARHAACPVLQVRLRGGAGPEHIHRLLVPMDDSALARQALGRARTLAASYAARLDLLHVIPPGARPGPPEATLRRALRDAFEQAAGPDVVVHFHVLHGRPARVIRAFIGHHGIDLVVQGAHADAGSDLLGSVAADVVRTASCSVLTVRAVLQATPATQAPRSNAALVD